MNAPFDETTGSWSASGLSEDDIERHQLERAWDLADLARRSTPFYERLGDPGPDRSRSAWESLPRTTKAEVVADCEALPPFGTRSLVSPDEIRSTVETSGTSGRGRAVFPLNAADELLVHQTEAIGFWWAGVRPGSRVHLTFPIGVTAAARWYDAGLRSIGANVFAVGPYPTDKKLEIMQRYGADVLIGTPTYLMRLAVAAEEAGLDPAQFGVSSLVVAGERYTRGWVEAIQDRWGATLYEQYGCTERAIAWTCPGGVLRGDGMAVLHFPADAALCEVVDPESGRGVAPGEVGELVVTPFASSASPLVRYRTGDRVELVGAGQCECGRPLRGIRPGRVERYDHMMKIRGVNIWPESFDDLIFGVPGVGDYRGVVTTAENGVEAIRVEVECDPADGVRIREEITTGVRRSLGLGVDVELCDVGELARRVPEGFVKVARWSDERASSGPDRHNHRGQQGETK